MNVVVAGELPLVEELTEICANAGHITTAYLVEDFYSAVQSGYIFEQSSSVDVVMELHNESAAAKQELLYALANAISDDSLIMTSAMATSTTQAAAWVSKPERVIGIGLLPPVKGGDTAELAMALQSSERSLDAAKEFCQSIDLVPVVVSDGAGLVRARIVGCLINEAVSALMEGIASAEDIDLAMKLGTRYPYGPLEWADLIGLDTVLGIMNGLFYEWGDDRYRPAPLLRRMVVAGRLGRKSGRGFFAYD
jgi:3-hydroxybutyryl-CoA dehydrogenase